MRTSTKAGFLTVAALLLTFTAVGNAEMADGDSEACSSIVDWIEGSEDQEFHGGGAAPSGATTMATWTYKADVHYQARTGFQNHGSCS